MSRRAAREMVLHLIFLNDFSGDSGDSLMQEMLNEERFADLAPEYELYSGMPEKTQMKYIKQACAGVTDNRAVLDEYIEKYSVGWRISRISRISRCILRLCMYEIKYMGIPFKASVNEAVELAKQYDSPEAAGFINGIMGNFIKDHESKTQDVQNADE